MLSNLTNTIQHLNPFLNHIICGDCQEVMREFPASSIDLIVTNPPYLINHRACDGCTVADDHTDA
jgi:DNA modification methylase